MSLHNTHKAYNRDGLISRERVAMKLLDEQEFTETGVTSRLLDN